jgi:hypothetical protein
MRERQNNNLRMAFDELPISKAYLGTSKNWLKLMKSSHIKYDETLSRDVDF